MKEVLAESRHTPVKLFYPVPAFMEENGIQTTGSTLHAEMIDELIQLPEAVGLAEVLAPPILAGSPASAHMFLAMGFCIGALVPRIRSPLPVALSAVFGFFVIGMWLDNRGLYKLLAWVPKTNVTKDTWPKPIALGLDLKGGVYVEYEATLNDELKNDSSINFDTLLTNTMTVQQRLEEALRKLTGETVSFMGASRTDAGVHAIMGLYYKAKGECKRK